MAYNFVTKVILERHAHTKYTAMVMFRVIHKSLQDLRPLRYSDRDGHAEREHVNRGTDTPILCPTLQVFDISTLGDAAGINPSTIFPPRMLHMCGGNLITGLTSTALPMVNTSNTCKIGQKLEVPLPLLTCSPSA